ncbi:MAG: leucyl/phenylalanyl-tRNA--protein transferase [Comamonadaceae bacterium CG12_big_fil_rev_8_21_14_0_65_59_15]|nr:MAG: leucyl/phenylalanyl-tRNA--protein transferase [Comamonadaceae bacterium CG12_big_fil_rev_8_21_14_0_65_59_15]
MYRVTAASSLHIEQQMPNTETALTWLPAGVAFPPVHTAWRADSDAPGLLCAGGDLSVATLAQAYRHTIFPWFSDGQPILWWSPDPRMVLTVGDFHLRNSFRKRLQQFARSPNCEIRVDSAFEEVIHACAQSLRQGQSGTWIVPPMVQAYTQLHHAGLTHSVETWIDGALHGGLYFVALGKAVFGESMFHRSTDSSKIALAALVAMCRQFGVTHIDCQQNTAHLVSMGAREVPREWFLQHVAHASVQTAPNWRFTPLYWQRLFATDNATS